MSDTKTDAIDQWWHMGTTHAENGRTRDHVRCSCGQRVTIYRWSWAGHGFKRCPGCKRKILYLSNEVRDE